MGAEEPRILVVDDDPHVRSALKRAFLCQGWDVSVAACGREALELLAAGQCFNVIVADYFMPNVNGIEFLKRVNQVTPETYCIMLTAYPYADAIKYAMAKYLKADLLQKPWDDRLVQMIEAALLAPQGKIDKTS